MALVPGFLGPLTRIFLPKRSAVPARINTLSGLTVSGSLQTNWCWAAVSEGVARAYNPNSPWTQCLIADQHLGRQDCCTNGGSAACNVSGYLSSALGIVGHFGHLHQGILPFPAIEQEMQAGRPVGVRIAFGGQRGHYVAIKGSEVDVHGTELLECDDPGPPQSTRVDTYQRFATAYNNHGTWSLSYCTNLARVGQAPQPRGGDASAPL
jgi:hypothetical protein